MDELDNQNNAEKLFEQFFNKYQSVNNRIAAYVVSLLLINLLIYIPIISAILLGIDTLGGGNISDLIRAIFYIGYFILHLGVLVLTALLLVSIFRLLLRNWRRFRPPHEDERYLVLDFGSRPSRVSVRRSGLYATVGFISNFTLMILYAGLILIAYTYREKFTIFVNLFQGYVEVVQGLNADQIILNALGLSRVFNSVSLQDIVVFCLAVVLLSFVIISLLNLMFLIRGFFAAVSDHSNDYGYSDVFTRTAKYMTTIYLIVIYVSHRMYSIRGKREMRRTVGWLMILLALMAPTLFIILPV